MQKFSGFPTGKVRHISIPAAFFTGLLPSIDHLGEMKVVLYALWFLQRQEGKLPCILYRDFAADERFMSGLGGNPETARQLLDESLARACERGALLHGQKESQPLGEGAYFLNSPRGRAALRAWQSGDAQAAGDLAAHAGLADERPNIYRLYEENIGPLTPLMADALRDAEDAYPMEWIEEALTIAVHNNVRRWRYVEAILRSWKEEGRHAPHQRDAEKDYHRYLEGKYADYIER